MSKAKINIIAAIVSDAFMTITYTQAGKPFTRSLNKHHGNFPHALKAYRLGHHRKLIDLLDIRNVITSVHKKLSIKGDNIYFGDDIVTGYLADKIIAYIKQGLPTNHLKNFLNNLLKNPKKDIQDELYKFLEAGQMPITPDGCFLAYKKVDKDLNSIFMDKSGVKYHHGVNKIVKMPREQVCEDRNQTCAPGLHFCAHGYLREYGTDANDPKVVLLKINPVNVVSIPNDYGNTKGRCCEYQVLAVLDSQEDVLRGVTTAKRTAKGIILKKSEGDRIIETVRNRDKNGRFCKGKV